MKSIYIICLIAAINANHMHNELEQLGKYYDALVDVAEIKYGDNCQTAIDNLMDLLCDGFQYCTSDADCIDKTEYQQILTTEACGLYEEVDYSIKIHPSNQYAPTHTSLTCEWTLLTTDGCTIKETEQHKIYYNDEGLITKFYDEHVSEYKECPQSTTEYPQEGAYQDEDGKEYEDTKLAKNDIVDGVIDYIADLLSRSTEANTDEVKNAFCIDIEYDALCDDDACAMFASKIYGRDGVLENLKQYENVFDEATSRYDYINHRVIHSYRKGSCQGEYSQRVEFEYCEQRQCISKWTDYLDDVVTSDEGCHNSAAAFGCVYHKTLNECKFDYEIDNEYIGDECQDNSDAIIKFFESLPAILDDCDSDYNYNVDHAMALLSDDFTSNDIEDGEVVHTENKDDYKQGALETCDRYKKVNYALSPISCNNVTVEWEITFMEGCTMRVTYQRKFVFDSQGLITRIDSREIGESSTVCPSPTPEYESEPEQTNGYIEDEPSSTDCQNNPYAIHKFFDTLSSIVGHCNLGDLMDLLSDDFTENHIAHGMVHHFVNKDEYRQEAIEYCPTLTKVGYVLSPISCNTVTVAWETTFNNSCTLKKVQQREFVFDYQGLITSITYQDIDGASMICPQPNEYEVEPSTTPLKYPEENEYIQEPASDYNEEPSTTSGYAPDLGFDAMIKGYEEEGKPVAIRQDVGAPMLIKKVREKKLKAFYEAAFECRLKRNKGNTELLDTFMDYLCDSAKLCVIKDNDYGDSAETCYDKDEIREMMGDRYADDNESIDYQVEIISNDGYKVESKCVSQRRKPNGCRVIKEEYDTCLFNSDGAITEFTVSRSKRRTDCDNYDDEE